jgi:hypothetical protein
MCAFDALDAPKSKIIKAASATFTLFVESVSDAVSSSSEPIDRFLLLQVSPNEPSWLNDDATLVEPGICDEGAYATSWDIAWIAANGASSPIGRIACLMWTIGRQKSKLGHNKE